MSHFTVLVIGDNVEEQLAPYNEELDNPNSKWDWWVTGGRWRGFFILKPGVEGEIGDPGAFEHIEVRDLMEKEGYSEHDAQALILEQYRGRGDQARKRDIDFDAMREAARTKAEETYDEWERTIEGTEPALPWRVVRENNDDIDAARKAYHGQPRMQAVQKSEALRGYVFADPIEIFQETPREAYVERQMNNAVTPYALLVHGEWTARGEMGFFGMSTDNLEQDEWSAQVWKTIQEQDDGTLFTLIDAHI